MFTNESFGNSQNGLDEWKKKERQINIQHTKLNFEVFVGIWPKKFFIVSSNDSTYQYKIEIGLPFCSHDTKKKWIQRRNFVHATFL